MLYEVITAPRDAVHPWRARRRAPGRPEAIRPQRVHGDEQEAETVMPGYTHLQRAQPVTLGHHLLAWVEIV